MSCNQYCLCIKTNLAATDTALEPISFPGSLILPPPGASARLGTGKTRDPGHEVALELPLLPLGPANTNPFSNENGAGFAPDTSIVHAQPKTITENGAIRKRSPEWSD